MKYMNFDVESQVKRCKNGKSLLVGRKTFETLNTFTTPFLFPP